MTSFLVCFQNQSLQMIQEQTLSAIFLLLFLREEQFDTCKLYNSFGHDLSYVIWCQNNSNSVDQESGCSHPLEIKLFPIGFFADLQDGTLFVAFKAPNYWSICQFCLIFVSSQAVYSSFTFLFLLISHFVRYCILVVFTIIAFLQEKN